MEVAPILEIPRAEEGSTELSGCEQPLRDRLRNGGLAHPSQPIQPEDVWLGRVPCPGSNFIHDGYTRPLEATSTVSMSMLGSLCTGEIIEDSYLAYRRIRSGAHQRELVF